MKFLNANLALVMTLFVVASCQSIDDEYDDLLERAMEARTQDTYLQRLFETTTRYPEGVLIGKMKKTVFVVQKKLPITSLSGTYTESEKYYFSFYYNWKADSHPSKSYNSSDSVQVKLTGITPQNPLERIWNQTGALENSSRFSLLETSDTLPEYKAYQLDLFFDKAAAILGQIDEENGEQESSVSLLRPKIQGSVLYVVPKSEYVDDMGRAIAIQCNYRDYEKKIGPCTAYVGINEDASMSISFQPKYIDSWKTIVSGAARITHAAIQG